MRPIGVFDTGALLAYATESLHIGAFLVDVADTGETVAVPAVCLAEAHTFLNGDPVGRQLDVLLAHPALRVVALGAQDADFVGRMAVRAQRLGAAHAAYVALSGAAVVFTSRADQIRAALDPQWPVREV